MKILKNVQVSASQLPENSIAEVHFLIVEIENLEEAASEMVDIISNTSWLKELGIIEQTAYEHIVKKTSERLVAIFKSVENEISKEFGEYFTALSAQSGLEKGHGHIKLPLAELWKEKVSNNPGFDFHTVSTCEKIVFGESKYLSSQNAYGSALEQVLDFNLDKKDNPDLIHIQKMVSANVVDNFINGSRAYCAAFSINMKNTEKLLEYVLKNQYMMNLCKTKSLLYLVGVVYESRND